MPIYMGDESNPATYQLSILRLIVTFQNEQIREVRDAAARVKRLGTEADCDEYRRLCIRMQKTQEARVLWRDAAISAGVSPRLVRLHERIAERTFYGHY